jgi:hypothetical protein
MCAMIYIKPVQRVFIYLVQLVHNMYSTSFFGAVDLPEKGVKYLAMYVAAFTCVNISTRIM